MCNPHHAIDDAWESFAPLGSRERRGEFLGHPGVALAPHSWVLEVDKGELDTARVQHEAGEALREGQIVLRVEGVAMTANTMTYAALGDALGYWRLFPAEPGWGRIPAWGHGRVIASRCAGCDAGALLFGLFPIASSVILTARRSKQRLTATDPHRSALNPVYNQYFFEPDAPDAVLAAKAAFHPLLILSFVLYHHLKDSGWFDADEVVVTSASSKTALGFAFLARNEVSCTGLTSSAQKRWLEATAAYRTVSEYGLGAGEILGRRVLIVDFSGSSAVVERIVLELGDRVVRVVNVGFTHVTKAVVPGTEEESARAELFFGPDHIERLVKNLGGVEFNKNFERALEAFIDTSSSWFAVHYVDGAAKLISAYQRLRRGALPASEILIARPNYGRDEGT